MGFVSDVIEELKSEGITRVLKRKITEEEGKQTCRYPPLVFNLETTNMCALNCKNCPRDSMSREIGFMDYSLFKDIIEEISEYQRGIVWLHHFGDPLLHPKLTEFVDYAYGKGVYTGISITGNSLTKQRAKKLANSEISLIRFSFMGVGENFENIQEGADYEKVKGNIEYLLSLDRGETDVEGEMLISSKTGEEEKEKFLSIWEDSVSVSFKETHDWIGDNKEVREVVKNKGDSKKPKSKCWVPWHSVSILWNGDVVPCCRDYDGFYRIGNLRKESLENIWNNSKMRKFRILHHNGLKNKLRLCKDCQTSRMSIKNIIKKFLII